MIQSFHDFDLPVDLLQITVVQLWFIDNFYGHLRQKKEKIIAISNEWVVISKSVVKSMNHGYTSVCTRAYDCIQIGAR